MRPRPLRKAAPGTTVVERDLVGRDVNKTIARYASFGWEGLDIPALRRTCSLTGALFFHRHALTIVFRKVSDEALRPELLPEPKARLLPEPEARPIPLPAANQLVQLRKRSSASDLQHLDDQRTSMLTVAVTRPGPQFAKPEAVTL
jgi:hypothetical protein